MNTQVEEGERIRKIKQRTEEIKYNLIGNAMTYGCLLVGIAVAVKEPTDYAALIALGFGCGAGKTFTNIPYFYPTKTPNLIKESQLEEKVQIGDGDN